VPRLLVLLDEPCWIVFPSVEAASASIEAIDVANELRAAFDEAAVPYAVEWLRPNVQSRLSVTNGEYCFVPSGPAEPMALLALLESHPSARTDDGEAVDLLESTRSLRAG